VRLALVPLCVFLGVAAAACGGGDKSAGSTSATTTGVTNPTGTASVTTHGRFRYPPVVVNNFMKSCTNGNDKRKDYCACTLDKLSNSVSVQDFARIGLSGGTLTRRMKRLINKAAVACADKL
jgi:hypothetical protein